MISYSDTVVRRTHIRVLRELNIQAQFTVVQPGIYSAKLTHFTDHYGNSLSVIYATVESDGGIEVRIGSSWQPFYVDRSAQRLPSEWKSLQAWRELSPLERLALAAEED